MRKILITSVILLLVVLGASAFILSQGNHLPDIARAQTSDDQIKHEKIIEIAVEKNINGEITSGEVLITFEDPATLPIYRETALGVFLKRDGKQLTLGTGSIEVEIGVEVVNDEEPVKNINVNYTGDPIEILVSSDTAIYEDVTEIPEVTGEDLETGTKLITRKIQLGSLEEIGENMIIRVWGNKTKGSVIADVLVYERIQ